MIKRLKSNIDVVKDDRKFYYQQAKDDRKRVIELEKQVQAQDQEIQRLKEIESERDRIQAELNLNQLKQNPQGPGS